MSSFSYYDENALSFHQRALGKDMTNDYTKFLPYLPKGGKILDAGCGGGRDAKYFQNQGYDVLAFDASREMVKIASEETGKPVLHLTFQDMSFEQEFDGVWASRSFLHIPYEEMPSIFEKMHRALKPDGIFYASYKYGAHHMYADGRDFYNMDEETIKPYLRGLFDVIEIWRTFDDAIQVSSGSSKSWLAVICRKQA